MKASIKKFGIGTTKQSKRTFGVIFMIVGLLLLAIIIVNMVQSPTMEIDYYKNLYPQHRQYMTNGHSIFLGSVEVPQFYALPVPPVLFLVGLSFYLEAEGKKKLSNRMLSVAIFITILTITSVSVIGYMNGIELIAPEMLALLIAIGLPLGISAWMGILKNKHPSS